MKKPESPSMKLLNAFKKLGMSSTNSYEQVFREQREKISKRTPQSGEKSFFLLKDLKPGDVIDKEIKIEGEFGGGAMGKVFLVKKLSTGDKMVLKMLSYEDNQDEESRKLFRQEIRAMKTVNHPHVAQISAVGQYHQKNSQGNRKGYYILMPFYEGGDLNRWLQSRVSFNPGKNPEKSAKGTEDFIQHFLVPLSSALEALHDKGIIHRDLKPANILLDQYENPYIADFGLSLGIEDLHKTDLCNSFYGTPDFISPEDARAYLGDESLLKKYLVEAEWFRFGLVLYTALTGKNFFPEFNYRQAKSHAHLERFMKTVVAYQDGRMKERHTKIVQEICYFNPHVGTHVATAIAQLLHSNPRKRVHPDGVSKFFQNAIKADRKEKIDKERAQRVKKACLQVRKKVKKLFLSGADSNAKYQSHQEQSPTEKAKLFIERKKKMDGVKTSDVFAALRSSVPIDEDRDRLNEGLNGGGRTKRIA